MTTPGGAGKRGAGPGWLARALVRVAALLAPPSGRHRFVREWEAELWHAARDGTGPLALVKDAAGAFADARALDAILYEGRGRTTMGDWMAGLAKDVRTAARGLLRTPAWTAVAVLTLGLGLGGTTAIYTLLDRVVLDPLPYPEADRLVRLRNQVPGVAPDAVWHMSTAQFVTLGAEAPSLEAVGLYSSGGAILETPSGPRVAFAWRVSHEVLPMLGARAQLGRLVTEEDDRPGRPEVAVLDDGFWRREFGADPGVVGRTVSMFGQPVEVVGVMEPGFRIPEDPLAPDADLYVPLQVNRAGDFGNNHVYRMLARMAPGTGAADVEAALARLTVTLPERFPRAYSQSFFERYGFRTVVTPLHEDLVGEVARNLWILMAAVALVFLIAAANVTNLFVVRMEGRRREMAVRSALGAGRAALARYLLSEALVLSVAGAALALAVAWWGVPGLLALAPDALALPVAGRVRLGASGVALTLMLALGVALALALYPLLAHVGPAGVASPGERGATSGRERQRLRGALVVTQVALAVTLVVGSALLVRSIRALTAVDPGFRPEGAVALDVHLDPGAYDGAEAMWRSYARMLQGLRALPGVTAVGMADITPMSGNFGCTVQGFEDREVFTRLEAAGLTACAGEGVATPGYFEAAGIPILEGRGFEDGDNDEPTRASVVISRVLADRFWPGEEALGKGIAPSGRTVGPFYRVVGVVGDVPASGLDGETAPAIYYPVVDDPNTPGNWGWWSPSNLTVVVRTAGGVPTSVVPAARGVVEEVDPGAPVTDVRTLASVVDASMGRLTFTSLLLGIAAAVALLLAAVGLYGVLSYVTTRRTREIGTRIAMGAEPGRVQRMVVGHSLGMVAVGLALGVALALAGGRVLGSLLYGVEPGDPVALAAASALLVAVALTASWIPARRASRIDPARALRAE